MEAREGNTELSHKVCKLCYVSKPFDCFHRSARQQFGLADHCKPCRKEEAASRYKRDWFHMFCLGKRSYCKTYQIDFDLTSDYLKSIWTDTCPVFGYEFVLGDKAHPACPALDRLDPKKGYVQGNVAFISSRANRIKYDASVNELRRIADWMESATTRA